MKNQLSRFSSLFNWQEFSWTRLLKVLLLVLIIYSPFFLHLGNLPLRTWDEARVVANAVEMSENGNYLVTYFNGAPEMWNTKPPLLIWCQVLFIKLMGNEELSLRMPSAIAGYIVSLMIVFFTTRYLKSFWFGFIAVLILISTPGFQGTHVTRTADYDAMLTLFTTLFTLSFFLYTETGKTKFLHLFFTGIALAVLTKSVQGLIFLPAIGIYALLTSNALKLLKSKWFYIDSALLVFVIAAYYLGRESVNPGYLEAVYNNELGGRLTGALEGHKEKFTYYIDVIYNQHFSRWFLFLGLGIFAAITFSKGIVRRFILYLTLVSFMYILIISSAETKLGWYTAPAMPLFALIAATTFYLVFSMIPKGFTNPGSLKVKAVQGLFIIAMFMHPYINVLDEVYKPKETEREWFYTMMGHFLQDAVKGKRDLDGLLICYTDYHIQLTYYTKQLVDRGVDVAFADPKKLKVGDKVVYSTWAVKADLDSLYHYSEIDSYYNVKIIRIDGYKN